MRQTWCDGFTFEMHQRSRLVYYILHILYFHLKCTNGLALVFLKLLCGFIKVVLRISCPLPNKTRLKFDQDFKVFEASALN